MPVVGSEGATTGTAPPRKQFRTAALKEAQAITASLIERDA